MACSCSAAKSCLILCHPMDCNTPGFLVLHCLQEFAQARVHWVGDDIQPSHHLSSPSPFDLSLTSIRVFSNVSAFDLRWQSIGTLASVLPMNIQGWFPLELTGLISFQSKGLKSFLQHHSSKASTLTMNSLKLMGSLLWFTERGGWGGQDNCSWLCIVAMWELPLFLENKSWGMTFHDIGTSLSNGSEKK